MGQLFFPQQVEEWLRCCRAVADLLVASHPCQPAIVSRSLRWQPAGCDLLSRSLVQLSHLEDVMNENPFFWKQDVHKKFLQFVVCPAAAQLLPSVYA